LHYISISTRLTMLIDFDKINNAYRFKKNKLLNGWTFLGTILDCRLIAD